jgi:uncharacterized protein with PIN domain
MKTSIRQRWIEIASRLAISPSERHLCPKCKQHVIEVVDVDVDDYHIERWLKCSECGIEEAVRLKKIRS